MSIATLCGYELTTRLLDQKSEHTLDLCFDRVLDDVLAGQQYGFYFSKHFSSLHKPMIVFSSLNKAFDDGDIVEHLHKLKQLKLSTQVSHYQGSAFFPAKFEENVLGFLWIESVRNTSLSGLESLLFHLVTVYVKQLSTLHYACIDPLSQLLNRQSFEEKVLSVVARENHTAMRQGYENRSWFLAILDIDHFKHVNDTYGHVIGDEIILLVAQLLKRNLREEDYIFRYGGEEFAVLFPSQNEKNAFEGLDRIRTLIADTRFPQVGKITVSGGFVELVDIEQTAEVVHQADLALYHSKQNGRNKITYFNSLDVAHLEPVLSDIELF